MNLNFRSFYRKDIWQICVSTLIFILRYILKTGMIEMQNDAYRLKVILNIIVLSLALFGISNKDFKKHDPSLFERAVINVFSPIQKGLTLSKQGLHKFFNYYFFLVDVKKTNDQLVKKISLLERDLFDLEELKRENVRLKSLLDFTPEENVKKILARVVSWDSSTKFHVFRVNKGKANGLEEKMTVVTAKGLVGHVYRLTDHYSDIITVLDPNNRIDAIVSRTRSHGIVNGHSEITCQMKYVTRTEPVNLQDKVMTSGLSNIYPKGILIGDIVKIERESYGITQNIEIRPAVDFSKLEEVIILKTSKIDLSYSDNLDNQQKVVF